MTHEMDLSFKPLYVGYLFFIPALIFLATSIIRLHFRRQCLVRLHGCAPPPKLPQIDPIFGLDTVFKAASSFRSNKRNASLGQQFSTYGTTFQSQVYSTTKIFTIAPQNLQSVFSNNFDS